MTLADIKIAALKLMFATYDNIVAANIADYYDDTNLNEYLYNMNESINRCFDRFLDDKVAPESVAELDSYTTVIDDAYTTIELDMTLITDLHELNRVIYRNGSYYDADVEYIIEGDILILPYKSEGSYKLVYTKTMPYIDDSIADTDSIVLPEKLLRLIPFFVKGELYEEEDPNLAAVAMNTFESRLMMIKKNRMRKQTVVKDVYSSGYYD